MCGGLPRIEVSIETGKEEAGEVGAAVDRGLSANSERATQLGAEALGWLSAAQRGGAPMATPRPSLLALTASVGDTLSLPSSVG
jgi:hypothetical protein